MKYQTIFTLAIPSTLETGHFNEYFIKNSLNFFLFIMPLTSQKPSVLLAQYHKGALADEKQFYWYRGKNNVLRYIFFYLYYLYIAFFILPSKSIVLTTTPQYCILSGLLDRVRQIKVVYTTGDYYPNPTGIMRFFNFLAQYYNKHLHYVLYGSPKMKEVYELGIKGEDGLREAWVFGIENKVIAKKIKGNLLGFIGVLRKGQGTDIILEALMKDRMLNLEIIGEGPLYKELQETVKKKKLSKQVRFWGLVRDNARLVAIIRRWEIALAPYDPDRSNMTFYTEPSKIKFYLEYGIPIIMTKVTHMYPQIDAYHAGISIDYTVQNLLWAVVTIQKKYAYYRAGVRALAQTYEYTALYNKSFKFLETIFPS